MSETITEIAFERSTEPAAERLCELQELLTHAAHRLPAQGPISVFVHHNTLHAFEDLPFTQAVVQGARIFGCHPYLPEDRYRRMLESGRIRRADVEAVLLDELGDSAHELVGFLGTRFSLRQAMLQFPLLIGPSAELDWVIAETDALQVFRPEVAPPIRERLTQQTRRWVMRDLIRDTGRDPRRPESAGMFAIHGLLPQLVDLFACGSFERWPDTQWETFCLHLMWQLCCHGTRFAETPASPPKADRRHRDLLFEATGVDIDQRVNEMLMRFCAAFLDQGFSDWELPGRERGFYYAFLELYHRGGGLPSRWFAPVRGELERLMTAGIGPLKSIDQSLLALGVETNERESFISQTLLSLRGWAGMIWQLETRGDRVARPAPEGSLLEFLAIRLILERFALQYAVREELSEPIDLQHLRRELIARLPAFQPVHYEQRAFTLFQLAQTLGWTPEDLYRLRPSEWKRLFREIEGFSGLDRRRVYHLAFERNYRQQALDAIAIHCERQRTEKHAWDATRARVTSALGARPSVTVDESSQSLSGEAAKNLGHSDAAPAAPLMQMITCIDDREESFRRHLEEVEPQVETFGAAGFFGVAMYYRGNAEAHYVPLCPIIVRPRHYVQEAVSFTFLRSERRRRRLRKALGSATHQVHLGSRTLMGGLLTGVLGSLATLPLVMRILLPRATARMRESFGQIVKSPPVTQLQLERTKPEPGPDNGNIGYSIDEMADIVERLLRDIGLTSNFARLLIVFGHGSSSLNNPHESAYNCGACAGARGGPNARAVAQMANDPRVRARLLQRHLPIPDSTVVIGGYHNTCDDSVIYFDLDRVPFSHRDDLERALQVVDEARARNAHERARRFASAPLNLTYEAALRHVESRAEDLSQARPEYNHATNALCLVGRREWSRGLFLDRRAFLQSYDPSQDDNQHTILNRILQAVIPVCAGINLEYYFSCVDHTGWGAGNKLPHNVSALLGVMDGAVSDLRPGLYRQMIEIHEPMRLMFIIEATPAALHSIMQQNPAIARLVRNEWVQLATIDAQTGAIHRFRAGEFEVHDVSSNDLPTVASSVEWYRGWRDHLGFATVNSSR
jgi:uncharacterized protein YbcC (UPF0753/DUF2309 family)